MRIRSCWANDGVLFPQATMALNFCMGKIVCETEAQQFSKALGAGSDAESDKVGCL